MQDRPFLFLTMKKIGFALSGGGIRGFFHSGFLHALKERNFQIDIISGTSAGAIAGSLYAADVDLKEVMDRFPRRMRSLFFEPNLLIKAKFNPTSILKKYLEGFLGNKTFEDLAVPIKINAVNISTGNTEILSEGSVLEAVLAASAVPGVFNVFHENGNIYLDGGLTMNLPASSIRYDCDILIGVNLLPFKFRDYEKLPSRRHLIQRSVDIYHKHNNRIEEDLCDVIVSPKELNKYATYNASHKVALFELGYRIGSEFEIDKSNTKRYTTNV